MSHTITITRLPDEHFDDVEYTIGGDHDYQCEFYKPCEKAWHRHPKSNEIVGDEWGNSRIGYHAYLEDQWMVPDNGCAMQFTYCLNEHVRDFGQIGTFALDLVWEDYEWCAQPIAPVGMTEGTDQ